MRADLIDRWDYVEVQDHTICAECVHYKGGFPARCVAFLSKIPNEIYNEGFDHTKPFMGDGGIRFEKIGTNVKKT